MTNPFEKLDIEEYFQKALPFLKKHNWIYNYPNTDVLLNNVFENIEPTWIPHLKQLGTDGLNRLPQLEVANGNWPVTLRLLFEELQSLKVEFPHSDNVDGLCDFKGNFHLSPKKLHEVSNLSALIQSECNELGLQFLVDIGSGLGYLTQDLNKKYGYTVLGIEGNAKNVELAEKIQQKAYPNSLDSVKYINHFVTRDLVHDLQPFLQHNFATWNKSDGCIGIVGLHACADLSITILQIFLELDFVKCLVIMPCCYHRLELDKFESGTGERFVNFPVSKALKRLHKELDGEKFLRRPFLRLACQYSGSSRRDLSQEDSEKQTRSLMLRAVLQRAANDVNCDVQRLKRKTGIRKVEDASEFLNNLPNTHVLVPKQKSAPQLTIADPVFKSKFHSAWNDHKEKSHLFEILTAFQATLQSLCEHVLLLDRVQFLRENGLDCAVYKVADDRISPRCHALVARRR